MAGAVDGRESFKSDLSQLMLGILSLYNRGSCDDPLDPPYLWSFVPRC